MSKGIGTFQQELLSYIPDTPVLENELLWNLAEKTGNIFYGEKINDLRFGQINKSFDNKFAKSIKSLSDRNLIRSTKRKILTFDEMIKFYPFKTKKYEIKYLRERLFTKLKNFVIENPSSVFSAPDLENHTLKTLFKNKDSQKEYFK